MRDAVFLPRDELGRLFDALQEDGFEIIGPRVANGVIRFDLLEGPDALPWGVADEQEAGRYRLEPGPPARAFAWTTAPQALKPLVFPPHETLWTARRDAEGHLVFRTLQAAPRRRAVIGARGCDLAALALHDAHFAARGDPWYPPRREGLFLVAVNCARSADTCFCSATGDGPSVGSGHDLALDELDEGYLLWPGSDEGEALLGRLRLMPAAPAQVEAAATQTAAAANAQQRRLPAVNLEERLEEVRASGAWEQVARRCLGCGNCTAVCPSCFCHRHTESPDLEAVASEHGREWDSCFSEEHSLLHGRPHRNDIAQRYRQWLSHKLGAWHSQYGRSGCTGCGRCITWCPVGIDLTASVTTVLVDAPA